MTLNFILDGPGKCSYLVFHVNGVACGELLMKEDGYYDWWPDFHEGYLPAWFLREIANKLDELNSPMDKELEEYFNDNPM